MQVSKPVFVNSSFREITPGKLSIVVSDYYTEALDKSCFSFRTEKTSTKKFTVIDENLDFLVAKDSIDNFGELHISFFFRAKDKPDSVLCVERKKSKNTLALVAALEAHRQTFTEIAVSHEYFDSERLSTRIPVSTYTII
jgi:hypothetical protein